METTTPRKNPNRCPRSKKVIFRTELDANIALAFRKAKDKGEKRFYPCMDHYHLTSKA